MSFFPESLIPLDCTLMTCSGIFIMAFIFSILELCQHIVDPLPPKWQLGGAYYDSFREVDADSIDECIGKCDPNGDCNGVLIYDQKASSCLIFESNTIFIPNSEAGSDSVEQCIVGTYGGLQTNRIPLPRE